MNQSEFRKLRVTGQLIGGAILVLSIALMILQSNGLYLLAGYGVFWVINYAIIHGFIGSRYVSDK